MCVSCVVLRQKRISQNSLTLRRFSPTDAANYSSYQSTIHAIARGIDPLFDMDVGDFTRANKMKMSFAALQVLRGAGVAGVGLLLGSASQQLRRWFESEPLLGTLARDSIIGANAGPSSPGTGYVLLHHVMGEINWGSWSYVRGGMGEVSAQIRNAAESVGVKIYPNSEVTEICPECTHEDENNRIVMPSHFDVVTKNGRLLHAKLGVVSNLNPTYTTRLIRPMSMMPAAYRRDVEAIDFKSPVMKLNLALDSLPEIAGKTAPSAQHFGTIHLGAQSIRELDESFEASQAATFADLPMIEMTIPSALDSTLAPDGKHVVSLFVQHVPAGKSFEFWQKHRDEYADKILKIVDEASPGFTSKILRREVLSPFDMEQIWHLSGGNIFHGAMSFDRLFHQRPVDSTLYGPLNSCYATPIQNLYFCGAGAHPGGGVTGAPGRNAAFAILKRIVR